MAELVYPAIITLARGVFAMQGLRFTLHGTEHVPRTGGAVMAVNHVGYMDFTYAGPLMRGMHHIPVDREAGAGSYRSAVEALRAGEIVGVFPEATISRSFELKEFKAGAVRMAAEARVPVLPTVIWGSQRVWTKGHPKRLGRSRVAISVTVGEPLPVDPAADAMADTDILRDRMERLLHEAQEAYGDRPVPGDDAWWQPARLGGGAPTPEEALALDRQERRERIEAAKQARDKARDKVTKSDHDGRNQA